MSTPAEIRINSHAYLTAFFTIGFAAIVAQVVLTREFLVVLAGNELVIGIILASWLAGIGTGAWLGALLADRSGSPRSRLLTFMLLMAVALPAQIALIRAVRGLSGVGAGEAIPLAAVFVLCPLATAPTSLLVGIAFPFAGRLAAQTRGEAVSGVAGLYIAESAGSLAGGVLFTFFLVETLLPMQTAFFNAALLGVGGFTAALTIPGAVRRGAATSIFVLLVAVAGFGLPGFAADLDRDLSLIRWRQNAGGIEPAAAAESRYQRIEVGRIAEQYNLYLNGAEAGYVPADFSHAQLAHFLISQHPDPKRILLISDGADGLLPAVVKYKIESLDYLLQDDAVLRLLAPFKSPEQRAAESDARIHIHPGDGRGFLGRSTASYDLIIALLPPPSNALLNRFYTEEFFHEAALHLNPGGVFITSLPMTPGYIGGIVGSYVGSINEALKVDFSKIVYCPGPVELAACSNTPGAATADIAELSRRWRSRAIEGEPFHEALFATWMAPAQVGWLRDQIEKLPPTGRNSDLQPTAYLFRLLIWNRTTAEAGGRGTADAFNDAMAALRGLPPWMPAAAIALLLAAAMVIRVLIGKPAPRFAGLTVIATTGFAAIALEILLIFTYQNLFGYVYSEIGLIIALFMAGLAAGAWWGRRLTTIHERITRRYLLMIEGFIAALCLLIPLAAGAGAPLLSALPGGRFLLIGILLLAGGATGAQFPLAVDLYLRGGNEKAGAGAGAIDSADHIGAALGAALTGVILVPVLGLWATALLLAALKAASAVILLRF
jgi:predicted membrane-bound spermidine synthase